VKKVSTKEILIIKSFLAAHVEENNAFWDMCTKPKIGIF
jgi:hypothetical protein